MAERHISVPKPFASGDAAEWFTRYEVCCKANKRTEGTPALKLPTLLEGEALAVWLEFSEEQQADYATAKEAICEAMMPMEFVSLDEFHRRKLRPGEAVSIFVPKLKKLLEQSMPSLDKPAKEKLILHQFLAGLPDAVSKQLRATGEVLALDGAVARTLLLMTVDNQEQSAAVSEKPGGAEPSDTELLREQVALLMEKVAALSTSSGPRSNVSMDGWPRPRRRPSIVIMWGTYIASAPIAIECRRKLEVVSRAASLDTLPEIATREMSTCDGWRTSPISVGPDVLRNGDGPQDKGDRHDGEVGRSY